MAGLLHERIQTWGSKYFFYCEGCKSTHSFDVRKDGGRPSWTFDGNHGKPTFTPSLHYPSIRCHLFVTAGKLCYLGDCNHNLAGQTVDMVEFDN